MYEDICDTMYIYQWLEMSMTVAHKQKLIQNRMRLIEDLEVTQVIPFLVQFGILDDRMVQGVMCHPVRQDQV